MKKTIELSIFPKNIEDSEIIRSLAAKELKISVAEITALRIIRRSLDARQRSPVYKLLVELYVNELPQDETPQLNYKPLPATAKLVHIVGFGPAGMFAALRLIELGIRPIVYERGKEVRERRRDIRKLMQEHIVDEDSNYCFGEGGAGTFSDGKLYTRSSKRGNIKKILQVFHYHGAVADILIDAHPHIGTNKLPAVVEAIKKTIIECGGEVHFNSKMTDISIEKGAMKSIVINNSQEIPVTSLIIAAGHSARDVYNMLQRRNVYLESKDFAVGVRIEHPQEMVNEWQYRRAEGREHLPAAAYFVACQIDGNGAFSFCMCPGGIIVPASTGKGELVLNGMSVSRRNSPFANAGFVVTVRKESYEKFYGTGFSAGLEYQSSIERAAYEITHTQKAPAQRAVDFVKGKESGSLPKSSYIPGLVSADLQNIFPKEISNTLKKALLEVEKKMPGYAGNDALLLAPETRTSSPVRIKRDVVSLNHVEIKGLIPSGEGAGYAGGIVSAAIDGELCAEAAAKNI